jgi:hypothetical protein
MSKIETVTPDLDLDQDKRLLHDDELEAVYGGTSSVQKKSDDTVRAVIEKMG